MPGRAPLRSAITAALIAVLLGAAASSALSTAEAEDTEGGDRSAWPICTGFDPRIGQFGMIGAWQNSAAGYCPDGYAFVGHELQGGPKRELEQIATRGDCCPLPAGALRNEHLFTVSRCPDGFVVTGGDTDAGLLQRHVEGGDTRGWWALPHRIRCTRIDTERFALGPARRGWRVGWGREPTIGRMLFGLPDSESLTTRGRIPEGLRYGIGRSGVTEWTQDHCIGYPFGALLVERVRGRECAGLIYRQLIDRRTGRPSAPSCKTIDNPLSANPVCLDPRSPLLPDP